MKVRRPLGLPTFLLFFLAPSPLQTLRDCGVVGLFDCTLLPARLDVVYSEAKDILNFGTYLIAGRFAIARQAVQGLEQHLLPFPRET